MCPVSKMCLSTTTNFEQEALKMWRHKIIKLSVFLILLILVQESTGAEATNSPPLEEGSGAESTTIIADDTSTTENVSTTLDEGINNTESPNNDTSTTESIPETTTDSIECVCDCTANGNQVTVGCSTQSPGETQTESTENSANNDSTLPTSETTTSSPKEETSTNAINIETTTESNAGADTTKHSTDEPEATIAAPPPICSTPGVQAHDTDCQQYFDCSLEGSQDGSFHLLTKSCPKKQAFNIELNRCSRDISSCSLPVKCVAKGGYADPASNSSYYLCEPRLFGLGFRIFHVDCASNEIFYPALGKCFVDFNNLPTPGFPPYNWNQIKDIDIVKAELKLLKQQDKLKLKQEKDRKKAEEKLQKELEKEAKKKAKEEEKANKEKAKQEAASFVCVEEGNFASQIDNSIYYACITKNGKLKALPMKCSFGAKFDGQSRLCVNNSTGANISISDDDEDEDDD